MSKTFLVLGAGSRGFTYGEYALAFPDKAKVVGVAEPRDEYRNRFIQKHNVKSEFTFNSWTEAAEKDKFADAVIISTQDSMHLEPALAFAKKGYHILLEKPMAPDLESCEKIVKAVKDAGVIFSVCHVLRYTEYTQKLKSLLNSNIIGDIVTIQHLEPVGWWHQAHSFVRGNWRNEKESSFMLLAKSCHDLDWISYVMGKKCASVSSFGSLHHFRKEKQPEGAADRCTDCSDNIESACPYSAKKIYYGFFDKGVRGWPIDVITTDISREGVTKAIKDGPYGRCVYACDNDVVDNQTVNLLFEDGSTCVFTMTAFNRPDHRKTKIFGTMGEIYGDGIFIEHFDFINQKTEKIDTRISDNKVMQGHGGGDFGIMDNFVNAIIAGDPSLVISGADETIESHRMVFKAEQARRKNVVVDM